MSEQKQSQQKTEKPTPKRLRDARKKGQVSFSRDANGAVVFAVAVLAIFGLVGAAASSFRRLYTQAVELAATGELSDPVLGGMGYAALVEVPKILSLLLVAMATVGLFFGFVQTRFNFSFHPLKPELKKLSPMKRLKQWFSIGGLFEFAKTLFKLLVVLAAAYLIIRSQIGTVLRLGLVDSDEMTRYLASLLKYFMVVVCLIFLAIGGLDFLFQRWKWMRDLRMTREEVKRDHKETEGEPIIRSRRRQLHRELGGQDLKRSVVGAQVVLIGHGLVVAVTYDRETMPAPKLAAKGQGDFAHRIVRLAEEGDVPVLENSAVARALYKIAVDSYVPRELFQSLAEVLAKAERTRRERHDPFAAAAGR